MSLAIISCVGGSATVSVALVNVPLTSLFSATVFPKLLLTMPLTIHYPAE